MGRYFGTDGFRGEYGRELTDAHAELVGRFLGEFYGTKAEKNSAIKKDGKGAQENESSSLKTEFRGAKILIGKDTRASSEPLEAALIRGIRAAVGEAFSLGVCTTPAVAFLARKFYDDAESFSASFGKIDTDFPAHFENDEEKFSADGVDFSTDATNFYADGVDFSADAADFSADGASFPFDAAVMITASHNPWRDNGIKIFDSAGLKLDEKITEKIEDFIDENFQSAPNVPIDERKENRDVFCKENPEIISSGTSENRADFAAESIGIYEEHLCSFGADFSGLRIGLDCANGAAFATAPRVFRRLGAEVFTIGTEPDGENINRGIGSTNISALINFVVENELDLGFAFDGDGDRCITVNRNGQVLDGDCEMLNLALDLLSRGELKGGKIALTVMSNLGLLRELEAYGIGAEICPVGDRFVAEKMRELGLRLGGEQSGHIIIGDEVTGDGILTAICLARIFLEHGFLWKFLPTPQVSENVSVREKGRIMGDERISFLLRELENNLHGEGRILLRPSGTENLIRIMVEHQNIEKCKLMVSKIGNLVRKIDEEEIL